MKSIVVYCLLLISSLLPSPSQAQRSQIDSLEKLLVKTPADTNRVLLLNDLSYQYNNWGAEPRKTKSYAEQCLQLAQQLHYSYGIGLGYKAIGNYYYRENQNPDALQQYERALQFYQQAGRKRGLAAIYGNIANVIDDMGNSARAMEYYLKSIRIAEEIDDKRIIGNSLSAIGILMTNQKKYEDALRYLFQALPFHESIQNDRSKAFTLNTIGTVYLHRKQYDKALQYLNQSLRLSDSLDFAGGKTDCYNNLGSVHFFLKQSELAFSYFQKALALADSQGDHQSMAVALHGIGDVYQQQGKTAQAVISYQKSLQLAETNQLVQDKLDAYEGLMQAYAQGKDYRQAYLHQSRLLALKDSIFTKENDQKIAQLAASYEVEKKQAEIVLLQKDQERGIVVRNAILAGLLASLIIIGLIVNRQRLKNHQNRLLLEKSQEIASKNTQLERQAEVMASQATELATTNAQLEQQTHQLQKLDQVKSHFFTNISHEFRTPLTLILAPLEKLQADTLEASQTQSQYQLIERNARQLLHLINQLLDFSKLEAGSLKVELIHGDVHQRLKASTFSFASLAESKHIHLHFRSEYQSIRALFDPDILEKILNNLLSNAFKFTPPGGQVTVAVAVQRPPDSAIQPLDQHWRLEITVKDTGIGIPTGQTEQIFDRFFQVEGSQLPDQPGTGIGLALVKELVALQQGSISVRSEVGQGTEFTVHLPLVECRVDSKKLVDQPTAEAGFAWLKDQEDAYPNLASLPVQAGQNDQYPIMLVVEDNSEVREFLRDSFLDGFRVVEACNGMEALQLGWEEMPDIIITDRMMPGMDGAELCRQLKTDERTSHIPVIMLTAKASEASKIEGLETGADDYILKPFRLQELRARVNNLIEQRKQLRERFSREVKLQPKDIAITSADEVFLRKAIHLIEEHMADTDFSVEVFVHEIGMSRVQLHRKLKALTDQSTTEFIRSIRLKRAASLLEQHYGNIAEVMYEVGFNNVSYFASNFKKMFGVNPSDYQVCATHSDQGNPKEK